MTRRYKVYGIYGKADRVWKYWRKRSAERKASELRRRGWREVVEIWG